VQNSNLAFFDDKTYLQKGTKEGKKDSRCKTFQFQKNPDQNKGKQERRTRYALYLFSFTSSAYRVTKRQKPSLFQKQRSTKTAFL